MPKIELKDLDSTEELIKLKEDEKRVFQLLLNKPFYSLKKPHQQIADNLFKRGFIKNYTGVVHPHLLKDLRLGHFFVFIDAEQTEDE